MIGTIFTDEVLAVPWFDHFLETTVIMTSCGPCIACMIIDQEDCLFLRAIVS